jgi:hypothetical protein
VHEDGGRQVNRHSAGSFGSEVGVEDDDPSGTPQTFGDGGSRLDGDLEAVRGAIG